MRRYGYYLAAASGVKVPKALKQGVTIAQLMQFGLFFAHSMYGLTIATDYRPRVVVVLCIFQAMAFATLFGHFFWCACGCPCNADLSRFRSPQCSAQELAALQERLRGLWQCAQPAKEGVRASHDADDAGVLSIT